MYNLFDGVISLVAGIWLCALVFGKKPESGSKAAEKVEKYGKLFRIAGPALIIFGIFRLTSVLV